MYHHWSNPLLSEYVTNKLAATKTQESHDAFHEKVHGGQLTNDAGYLLPVEEVLRCFWEIDAVGRRLIVMTLMMT